MWLINSQMHFLQLGIVSSQSDTSILFISPIITLTHLHNQTQCCPLSGCSFQLKINSTYHINIQLLVCCCLSVSLEPLHLSVQYVYALLTQPVTFFFHPHAISCKFAVVSGKCLCFWVIPLTICAPNTIGSSSNGNAISWEDWLAGWRCFYTQWFLFCLGVPCVRHRHEGVRMGPQKYRLER